MKRLLLLTVSVLCIASLASAQPGTLGLYADTGGLVCNVVDNITQALAFHVVHTNTGGATAVEFAVPQPTCLVVIQYLSWSTPFAVAVGNPVIGTPTATPPVLPGTSIAYGSCMNTTLSNILVGTATYFAGGLTGTCCEYPVVPHQVSGLLSMTDCSSPFPIKQGVGAASATVNGNQTCPCGVTPTHNSTWGGVKAIYGSQEL